MIPKWLFEIVLPDRVLLLESEIYSTIVSTLNIEVFIITPVLFKR